MKKMFAASLVAIMAVSAANAEIASVSYTDKAITEKTGDISTLETSAKSNLTAAVNELAGKITETGSDATDAIDAAKTELQGSIDDLADVVDGKQDALGYTAENAANRWTNTENYNTVLEDATKYPNMPVVNQMISDSAADATAQINSVNSKVTALTTTVNNNKTAADTGIQEAKDAAAAASTAAANALTDAKAYTDQEVDALSDSLDGSYVSETEMTAFKTANTTAIETAKNAAIADAASKDTALETKITTAYEAADATTLASAKSYADEKAAAATGSATAVAEDLADYIETNNTAVAAAKSAADAAQADADANATAISNLGETYATDAELNTAKSDIKTAYEAADATTLSSAKTYAKEYADGLADNYATAAQGAKADTAVQKADVTTGTTNGTIKVQGQEVSVAGLGTAAYTASSDYATAAQGAKADTAMQESALKGLASWSSAGCATGTCSLVSKSGEIQWEAVRYAE
ncbi:MAG: hypothetical protein IJD69_02840 [Alphaproteobacteria bacterium]|nr:hypothetical protein [Alphaproteobacteria bacterium]